MVPLATVDLTYEFSSLLAPIIKPAYGPMVRSSVHAPSRQFYAIIFVQLSTSPHLSLFYALKQCSYSVGGLLPPFIHIPPSLKF